MNVVLLECFSARGPKRHLTNGCIYLPYVSHIFCFVAMSRCIVIQVFQTRLNSSTPDARCKVNVTCNERGKRANECTNITQNAMCASLMNERGDRLFPYSHTDRKKISASAFQSKMGSGVRSKVLCQVNPRHASSPFYFRQYPVATHVERVIAGFINFCVHVLGFVQQCI